MGFQHGVQTEFKEWAANRRKTSQLSRVTIQRLASERGDLNSSDKFGVFLGHGQDGSASPHGMLALQN